MAENLPDLSPGQAGRRAQATLRERPVAPGQKGTESGRSPFRSREGGPIRLRERPFGKQAGVGMLRIVEDGLRGTAFDDFPPVEDGDPVGEVTNHGDIVGDEEQAHGLRIDQGGEDIDDLGPHGEIE